MENEILSLCSICGISPDMAKTLLRLCDGKVDLAINSYFENPSILSNTEFANHENSETDIHPSHPQTETNSDIQIQDDPKDSISDQEENSEDEVIRESMRAELYLTKPQEYAWDSSKLEQQLSPPPGLLVHAHLFEFLSEIQTNWTSSLKKSKSFSPSKDYIKTTAADTKTERSGGSINSNSEEKESLPSLLLPIVFARTNSDFMSFAIYRDVFKTPKILKEMDNRFRLCEVDSDLPAAQSFLDRYEIKDGIGVLFLHPITWESLRTVDRKDFRSPEVFVEVIKEVKDSLDKASFEIEEYKDTGEAIVWPDMGAYGEPQVQQIDIIKNKDALGRNLDTKRENSSDNSLEGERASVFKGETKMDRLEDCEFLENKPGTKKLRLFSKFHEPFFVYMPIESKINELIVAFKKILPVAKDMILVVKERGPLSKVVQGEYNIGNFKRTCTDLVIAEQD